MRWLAVVCKRLRPQFIPSQFPVFDRSLKVIVSDGEIMLVGDVWCVAHARRPDLKHILLHEPLLVDEDYSVPLLERPNGRQLLGLQRGDHVIVTCMDRGFRNTRDAVDCYDCFERYGVSLHLLDPQLDTSTTLGRLIFKSIPAAVDFDRRRLSERVKSANRIRSDKGLPVACVGSIAIGWKRELGETKTGLWEEDNEVRDDCRLIHQLHDGNGMSYERIYNSFWQHDNKLRKDGSEWSLTTIKRHHDAYKHGFPMQGRSGVKSK